MKLILYISLLLFCFRAESQIIVDFKADSSRHCTDSLVTFTDNSTGITEPVSAWLWNFGDGETSTDQNPTHIYSTSGLYNVTLTATNTSGSYSAVKNNFILIRDLPDPAFLYTQSTEYPFYMKIFYGSVNNNDGYEYKFSWTFNSDTGFLPHNDTTWYLFPSKGDFPVVLTVESGKNCYNSTSQTITIADSLEIPNVFSPNGDNINDVFEFRTNGVTTYEFTVYNRWGAIIYTVTSKKPSWDGFSNAGILMPPGSYFFILKSTEEPSYEKAGIIVLR